jgi:hypothetical protein
MCNGTESGTWCQGTKEGTNTAQKRIAPDPAESDAITVKLWCCCGSAVLLLRIRRDPRHTKQLPEHC